MSTNLKAAVSEAIGEKIEETGNPKGSDLNVQYDPSGQEKLDGDDLTDEGDGPAIVEAGVDEDEEYGGNKGDESRSDRDYEAALEGDDDDDEDEDNIDVNIDVDSDDDDDDEEDDDDLDEVLEIIEDEDEEEIADDAYAVDDDDTDEEGEEDLEERGMMMKKMEASIKENRQLRRENRRYEKALTFLKKRIDEVNLFNSRLAAASDLMRKVSLTKGEKERVVEHFDRARTVGEVKRTHKALAEGYTAANRSVKKQRVARPNVQSVISEEQKQAQGGTFDRLTELAGL
tara:strand:- start:173 stop:1033 length:861 start_codon:yes stop_codon:yes gene_type:complete